MNTPPNIQTSNNPDALAGGVFGAVIQSTNTPGVPAAIVDGDLVVKGNFPISNVAGPAVTIQTTNGTLTLQSDAGHGIVFKQGTDVVMFLNGAGLNLGTNYNVNMDGGFVTLASYVKTALPSAATPGRMIYVSNATRPGGTGSLCFSNGTVWVDATTGNAVV